MVLLEPLNPGFFERVRGSFRSVFLDNNERGTPENSHIGPFRQCDTIATGTFPSGKGAGWKNPRLIVLHSALSIATQGRWLRDYTINGVTPETEEVSVTVVAMDVSTEPVGGMGEELARHLIQRARTEGLKLTGEGGLLTRLTNSLTSAVLPKKRKS